MKRSASRGFAAGVFLALGIGGAGCAGPDRGASYVAAYAAGESAVGAGHFAEGAAHFDDAAREAKIHRDGEHASYLAARALESSGDLAGAGARLRVIAEASPPLEDSASAAYALGEMEIARGDEAGWEALMATARRFSSSGIARRALRRVIAHDDDRDGPRATLGTLQKLAFELDRTDLAETIAYETALHLVTLGEDARARDAYLAMATRWAYPHGVFWDDALFRASELDEKLGRFEDAAADLTRMLAERESSILMGSYERPRYEPAMIHLCAIYRDDLHDAARAGACFERFYQEFTNSELRDDALWEEARLLREKGDTGAACGRLQTMTTAFPDSRYVPCAMATCPALSRPAKSHAPLECHPYIADFRLGVTATRQ